MPIFRKLLETICACLLAGVVIVPLVQVIARYVFVSPFVGAEELTRFLLVCLVFMGYPLVIDSSENIMMSELRESLPDALQRVIQGVIILSTIAASGFIAYATVTSIQANLTNSTPTLKIPFWLFLGSTVFGFLAASLLHVVQGIRPPPHHIGNVQ